MQKRVMTMLAFICLCFTCASEGGKTTITILDHNGYRLKDATVILLDPSSNIISSGSTDVNGEFLFVHHGSTQQTLEVIATGPDTIYHGAGIIQIKPDEPTELTIMLN